MAKRDYYESLGVERGADADALKRAYRKLAMRYHPDRNPGDAGAETKFKEVSEAYQILSDDEKRAAYDRFGHAAFDGAGAGGGGAGFGFTGANFADVFDDLFGEVMGRSRSSRSGRGADLRYDLEIGLEEAFAGKRTSIRATATVSCDPCGGSGAEAGSRLVDCASCRGLGKVRAQQGFFSIERTCPQCQGAGRVIETPCRACRGAGRVAREKQLQVDIPPGVEDGTRIRLSGEGEAGMRGAPAGDLYIFIAVSPHSLFTREGRDLYCRVPLPMVRAALGGPVEVPTLDGKRAVITVPAGTQTGHRFRLRGKGMPVLRAGGAGDLFVQTAVETPVDLTDEQRDLLRRFEAAGTPGAHPESEGFLARVKEFWEDLRD